MLMSGMALSSRDTLSRAVFVMDAQRALLEATLRELVEGCASAVDALGRLIDALGSFEDVTPARWLEEPVRTLVEIRPVLADLAPLSQQAELVRRGCDRLTSVFRALASAGRDTSSIEGRHARLVAGLCATLAAELDASVWRLFDGVYERLTALESRTQATVLSLRQLLQRLAESGSSHRVQEQLAPALTGAKSLFDQASQLGDCVSRARMEWAAFSEVQVLCLQLGETGAPRHDEAELEDPLPAWLREVRGSIELLTKSLREAPGLERRAVDQPTAVLQSALK